MQDHLDQLENFQHRLYNLGYNLREVRVAVYGPPPPTPQASLKGLDAVETPQCFDEKFVDRITSLHNALNEIEETASYLYQRLVSPPTEGAARANR